jgi:septum formation protein
MSNLILASTSPYRKMLLERITANFTCESPGIDEDILKAKLKSPQELTEALAFQKAEAVFAKNPDAIVVGGDQVACLGKEILGKPGNHQNALEQLASMSGKTHSLVTSICILSPEKKNIFTNITSLKMKELSNSDLEAYLKIDKPYDCAGSYKIEEKGILLFDRIETDDFTAITGLPVIQTSKALKELGVQIF